MSYFFIRYVQISIKIGDPKEIVAAITSKENNVQQSERTSHFFSQ